MPNSFATPWSVACQILCPRNSPGKNTGVGCISFSSGSSWPRDWTYISCIGKLILYHWATREARLSLAIPAYYHLFSTRLPMQWYLNYIVSPYYFYFIYFLDFLFCIGVQLMNNVVIVSGEQPRDSAILVKVKVAHSSPALCDPMDCSLPGSSVNGILQARILEWVAISFSKGSSQPRNWTQVPHIAGRFFTDRAMREAQKRCCWVKG